MQFNFSQGVGVKGGLAPSPVLTTVEGRLHTVAGEVRTKWELLLLPPEADQEDSKRTEEEGRSLPQAALEVSVPVGATDGATVVFPCVGKAAVITEAITGQVVWQNGGFVVAAASLPAAPQEEAAAAAGAGAIVSGVRVEHGGVALRVQSGAREKTPLAFDSFCSETPMICQDRLRIHMTSGRNSQHLFDSPRRFGQARWKNGFLSHLCIKSHLFTKTGSGQT